MTSLTIRESSLLGMVEGEGSLAGRKALYFKRELAVKRKPDLVHSKVRQNTYSRTKKKSFSKNCFKSRNCTGNIVFSSNSPWVKENTQTKLYRFKMNQIENITYQNV